MSDVMSFSAWMLHSLANGLQPLMVSAICGGGGGGCDKARNDSGTLHSRTVEVSVGNF